jgi:hypothetical protein
LRRRRPKAVDGLAISSQLPVSFVGENFPICEPRGRRGFPRRGFYQEPKRC